MFRSARSEGLVKVSGLLIGAHLLEQGLALLVGVLGSSLAGLVGQSGAALGGRFGQHGGVNFLVLLGELILERIRGRRLNADTKCQGSQSRAS